MDPMGVGVAKPRPRFSPYIEQLIREAKEANERAKRKNVKRPTAAPNIFAKQESREARHRRLYLEKQERIRRHREMDMLYQRTLKMQ